MQKQKPQISVILPFFNSEKTLKRAITSIQEQTATNFECILIDNNSTDNSVNIAQKTIDGDSRFILVKEEKQGVVNASNRGWEESYGEFIVRMDSDDWAHPHRLEMQYNFMINNPDYGAVGSLVQHMSHSNMTGGMARFVDWNNSLIDYVDIFNNRFIEMPIINPSAMWRREVALKHGMYREGDFPEDYEMWLRWLDAGIKVGKVDSKLLNWHDSDTRLSRTDSLYSVSSFYRIKTKYLAGWLEKNNPFHPNVSIWGASKISRRRAKLLEKHGINIVSYIDTKNEKRQLDKEVHYYKNIPSSDSIFVLVYIKQSNARAEIKNYLISKGFKEGINFLLVS